MKLNISADNMLDTDKTKFKSEFEKPSNSTVAGTFAREQGFGRR
jgi:hypothetical protein